jgi:hypothetical protein
MIFIEKKVKDGFEYETKQFVGDFYFKSDLKISSNILDNLVFTLSSGNSTKGEVIYKNQKIFYEFEKSNLWLDDDDLKESN